MNWSGGIQNRAKHVEALLAGPTTKAFGAFWFLVSAYDVIRSQFLPNGLEETLPDLFWLFGQAPMLVWLLLGSIGLLVLTLESSFRQGIGHSVNSRKPEPSSARADQFRELARNARELSGRWPQEDQFDWRLRALDALSEVFGEESRYYQEFHKLDFGGTAPVTWGRGAEGSYSPEVSAFRDVRSQDLDKAAGILEAAAKRIEPVQVLAINASFQ